MRNFLKPFNLDIVSIAAFLMLSCAVLSAAEAIPVITIKDHRFSPEQLKIPAGKKIKIIVRNEDTSPEEFESYDLKREKVVGGKGEITLFIGPLKPGVYKYFGDFHPQTAQGRMVAKENG